VSETFGLRGSKNITSWVLAGAAAYYLFYLPEKQRVLEIQVRPHACMYVCVCGAGVFAEGLTCCCMGCKHRGVWRQKVYMGTCMLAMVSPAMIVKQ
jgi:hypothetical protein